MNSIVNAIEDELNKTTTLKGGIAHETTKSTLLDYFSVGGAMREMSQHDIETIFFKSFLESPELTLKAMFYFRDIRGGQGQRCGFYTQLKYLAFNYPEVLKPLLIKIPEFGRWDDLYQLVDTPLQATMFEIIASQLKLDLDAKTDTTISLLGKWLKSENASSPETKRLGKITRKALNMSSKEYRKMLTSLRTRLDIVEQKMAKSLWDEIEYPNVPSQAMLKYKTAFFTHDEVGMTKFIDRVKSGDVTINTGTLYPQQIVAKVMENDIQHKTDETLDVMWDNLPEYITNRDENSLAVIDVSGSMYSNNGLPIQVAMSLGLYLSERAHGIYNNTFITFSDEPKLVRIQGNTLHERILTISRSSWGYSTNISRVFDTILTAAVNSNIPQHEMIDKLYVISDMQFDTAFNLQGSTSGSTKTVFQSICDNFSAAGYEMPKLVFWNVNASKLSPPMVMDDNCQFVSGFSPSLFENLMKGEFKSAYDLMLEILEDDRYSDIKILNN